MRVFVSVLLAFWLGEIVAKEQFTYQTYDFENPPRRINLVPAARNMNSPRPCAGSFAFAIAHSLATQINRAAEGSSGLTVSLSPQAILNCLPETIAWNCADDAAKVDIEKVFEHLKTFPIPSESCAPYTASDARVCEKTNRCKRCFQRSNNGEIVSECSAVEYKGFKLKSWQKIVETPEVNPSDLVKKVIESLKKIGPLVCLMSHSEKLFDFRTREKGKRFEDEKSKSLRTYVLLSGYAFDEEKNDYRFFVQTPFGENVGYHGAIYLSLEDATASGLVNNCYSAEVNFEDKSLLKSYPIHSAVEYQGKNSEFADWRTKDLKCYLTEVIGYNYEYKCMPGWAAGLVSLISDLHSIARISTNEFFPKSLFSLQAIFNCRVGGSCKGGDIYELLNRLSAWKLPVDTCQSYTGSYSLDASCQPESLCSLSFKKDTRPKVYTEYNGIRVKSWKRVQGVADIKTKLQTGPLLCQIYASTELKNYQKKEHLDIFSASAEYTNFNHAVEIVGWNSLDGMSYWIVKNTWGREWGYDGYGYIKSGENLLGIESECVQIEVAAEDIKQVSAHIK